MLSQSIVSYIAAETIPAGARVKFVSGSANRVELAGANDIEIGTAILFSGKSSYAAESAVGVALANHPGTRTVLADACDITEGESLYRANDGKVADSGTSLFGVALAASSAANDNIEALLLSGVESLAPTVVALSSTNGTAAAAVDLDALKTETEHVGDDVRAIHAALVARGILAAS